MGITIDGQDVTEITVDGQQVTEVTVDGNVVWTAGSGGSGVNTTTLDDFESYADNSELRTTWTYGLNPDRFELETSNPIADSQSITTASDGTPDAVHGNIDTPWGHVYVFYVRIANGDSAPGVHLQVQNGDPKGYGYWLRLNARDGQFQGYSRANGGHDETLWDVSQSFSTGLYRIEVDLGHTSSNTIAVEVFDEAADPDTAIVSPSSVSPSTVHTGGQVGLAGGFTAGDVWDDILQADGSLASN